MPCLRRRLTVKVVRETPLPHVSSSSTTPQLPLDDVRVKPEPSRKPLASKESDTVRSRFDNTRSGSVISSTGSGGVPGARADQAAILGSVVVRVPVPAPAHRAPGGRCCRGRGGGLGAAGGRGGGRSSSAELSDLALARRRRGRGLGRRSRASRGNSGGGTDLDVESATLFR